MKTNNLKSVWSSFAKIASMLLLVTAFSFTFYSCEGEDEPSGGNCNAQLTALVEIVQQKSSAFSANPTSANCSALRTATLNMITKAEACGQGNIHAEAKAYWQAMDCSEFD